jgi:regulator of RNase E activity RraA
MLQHHIADPHLKKSFGMTVTAQHRGSAGRLPVERIRATPKPIAADILDRYRKLVDLSSTISDILDRRGIVGAFGASNLPPTIGSARAIGRAITVRNARQPLDVRAVQEQGANMMTEIEGMHQADPGDVLVIEGLRDISNMGGVMATVAHATGLAGAIVDGGIRDVGHSRSLGFPIWARDVSPVTGKWRAVTQEINGPVTINDITVHAGDLVVADETGIVFVPAAIVEDVLVECEAIQAKENDWMKQIQNGLSIPDLVKKIF